MLTEELNNPVLDSVNVEAISTKTAKPIDKDFRENYCFSNIAIQEVSDSLSIYRCYSNAVRYGTLGFSEDNVMGKLEYNDELDFTTIDSSFKTVSKLF